MALLALTVGAACSPGLPAGQTSREQAQVQPGSTGPRGTLKIAWFREPESLAAKFYTGPGMAEFGWTFNSSLTYLDFAGLPHPMMASEIPTRDNGGWVVNADGTMVTTYRLRPNIRWHDGAPVTSHDFAFAFEVYADRDVPVYTRTPETLMSSVKALDDHMIAIAWNQPYVGANLLGYQALDPLPRHLLEEKYRTNKAQFADGEEWRATYVGTGPFRMERWEPGTRMVARANSDWFLGPPKLDTIDIRFIPNSNTIMANLLSGEAHITNSPSIRGAEAAMARDQWLDRGEGYLKVWETRLRYLHFQHREVPNWQRAVADQRVRQALMHALDRHALVDGVNFGLGGPADSFFLPSDALFTEVDRAVSKYPYDPARATAVLAEAGWRSSSAGAQLADPSGQTLSIDVWSSAGTNDENEIAIISHYWQSVGINSQIFVIPAARRNDEELGSGFTGARTAGRTISSDNFVFTSDNVPKEEFRWAGNNRGSFRDVEIDRLHNLVMTALDAPQRRDATLALHKRFTELVGIGHLYYDVEVILARNALKGPIGNYGPQQGITWNIFEWELTE
ncbi:MAG: hypothetical protein HW416_284 [Chloroflexi bacterium]|nr:hypothetical protein [Chloroflexota bacterium]